MNRFDKFESVTFVIWCVFAPKGSSCSKNGKKKVQGVPQSQTAALPRPQEEEETDKSKQLQTYEKH